MISTAAKLTLQHPLLDSNLQQSASERLTLLTRGVERVLTLLDCMLDADPLDVINEDAAML